MWVFLLTSKLLIRFFRKCVFLGTDIHIIIEVRTTIHNLLFDPPSEGLQPLSEDWYHQLFSLVQRGALPDLSDSFLPQMLVPEWYALVDVTSPSSFEGRPDFDSRSYEMFTVLSGELFSTTSGVGLTRRARGLPSDASEALRQHFMLDYSSGLPMDSSLNSFGAHTASWLTYQDLLEFDWGRKVVCSCDGQQFSLQDLVDNNPFYHSLFSDIKLLSQRFYDPSHVRMVFWFDN